MGPNLYFRVKYVLRKKNRRKKSKYSDPGELIFGNITRIQIKVHDTIRDFSNQSSQQMAFGYGPSLKGLPSLERSFHCPPHTFSLWQPGFIPLPLMPVQGPVGQFMRSGPEKLYVGHIKILHQEISRTTPYYKGSFTEI